MDLFTIISLIVVIINIAHSTMLLDNFRKVFAYDDKKICLSVMWTKSNLRKVQCLAECSKEKYCLGVHISANVGVCVALREPFDGTGVFTEDAPGYQLFQKNKPPQMPGSECEFDVDCLSLSQSNCRAGKCQCNIGYGIYETHCRILTECGNFSDKFTLHEKKKISDNVLDDKWPLTRTECQQMCIPNEDCRSADYIKPLLRCSLQNMTWYDAPVEDRTDYLNMEFYQRECDW